MTLEQERTERWWQHYDWWKHGVCKISVARRVTCVGEHCATPDEPLWTYFSCAHCYQSGPFCLRCFDLHYLEQHGDRPTAQALREKMEER